MWNLNSQLSLQRVHTLCYYMVQRRCLAHTCSYFLEWRPKSEYWHQGPCLLNKFRITYAERSATRLWGRLNLISVGPSRLVWAEKYVLVSRDTANFEKLPKQVLRSTYMYVDFSAFLCHAICASSLRTLVFCRTAASLSWKHKIIVEPAISIIATLAT